MSLYFFAWAEVFFGGVVAAGLGAGATGIGREVAAFGARGAAAIGVLMAALFIGDAGLVCMGTAAAGFPLTIPGCCAATPS